MVDTDARQRQVAKGIKIVAIGSLLAAFAYVLWGVGIVEAPFVREYFHRIPFDSAAWRDESQVYSDDPVRARMVNDLLRKHQFAGASAEEVIRVLGPPMPRNEYLFYNRRNLDVKIPETALVYYLGDQIGYLSFDSKWLVFVRGTDGQVAEVRVVVGGVQGIRNPYCAYDPEIEKLDKSAHRIFISDWSEETLKDPLSASAEVKEIAAYVRKCQPTWKDDWRVNFFTERGLAGPQDDPQLAAAVSSGEWARAYRAEYTNKTGEMVLNPALPTHKAYIVPR
jgi:hypothetical protein